MSDDKRKVLYGQLTKDGYDLGDYNSFSTNLDKEENRKSLYDAITKDGYDVGDYNTFNGKIVTVQPTESRDIPVVPWQQPQNYVEQSPALGVSPTQHLTDAAISANNVILNDNSVEPVRDDKGRPYYPVKPKAVMEDEIRKEYQVEPVESQINKAIAANEEEIAKIKKGANTREIERMKENPISSLGFIFGSSDNTDNLEKERLLRLEAEHRKLQEAKNTIETSRTYGIPSNIGKGIKDAVLGDGYFDFGMSDMNDNAQLLNIKNKLDNKQPLTDDERKLLNAAALAQDVTSAHQDRISPWYTAGQTTANVLPFMAEMALNPAASLGKAAQKAVAKKIAGTVGSSLTKKILPKLTRAAGDVAGASVMTMTTGAMRTTADAGRRMLGDVDTNIKDGQIVGEGFSGGLDTLEAGGKAFGANTIENWSEMLGEYFAPALKGVGNVAGKGMRKIGAGKVMDFIADVNATDFSKGVNDILEQTKWNGPIGEIAEEEAGIIANSYITGDNKLSDLTDPKQQLDIILGVGLFGGFVSGLKTVGYKTPSKRAESDLLKSEKNASKKFSNWDELKTNINNADDTELSRVVDGISNSDVIGGDRSKKAAIIDYAYSLQKWRGVNAAKLKQGVENPEAAQELMESEGGEATVIPPLAIDKVNVYRNYKRAERKINSLIPANIIPQLDGVMDVEQFAHDNNLNDNQAMAVSDYLSAKQPYNQYEEQTNQRREEAKVMGREAAIAQLDGKINQETGYVVQAKMFGNDKPVYLTGGNLVFGDDGILDKEKSTERIYYFDESKNTPIPAKPDKFDALISINSPEEIITRAEIDAELGYETTEKESLRTPELPLPVKGETVTINGSRYLIEGDNAYNPGESVMAIKLNDEGEIDIDNRDERSVSLDEYYSLKEDELWKDVNNHPESEPTSQEKKVLDDGRLIIPLASSENEVAYNVIDRNGNTLDSGSMSLDDFNTLQPFVEEREEELNDDGTLVNNLPVENVSEITLQNENIPQSEEGKALDTKSLTEETPAIPSDDKGNLLYHKAPVGVTIDSLYSEELEPDEMDSFVKANKDASSKLLSSLEGKAPKVGTNIAKYKAAKLAWQERLSDAKVQVDYWNSVGEEITASRVQPGDKTAEAILSMGEPMNGEELAATMLVTGRLPVLYDSYKKETGGRNAEAREMFGLFVSKANGGMTIEKAGEQLMLADQENGTNFFDQDDPNAGRNAIIEVLSGARTRGDLSGYIQRNREAMAERERQVEYDAYTSWTEDNFGMTPEDYESYEEQAPSSIAERFKDFDEEEFYNNIANELNGEQREIAGVTTGSEVLQGEGVVSPERTEASENEGGTILVGSESSSEDGVISEEASAVESPIPTENTVDITPNDLQDDTRPIQNVEDSQEEQRQFVPPTINLGENVLDYTERVAREKKEYENHSIISVDTPQVDEVVPESEMTSQEESVHIEEGDKVIEDAQRTLNNIAEEREKVNQTPTEAQKEAGNYKKGHVKVDGYNISIESPKGSERSGVDTNWQSWSVTMNNDYGYIRGTESVDGDHIDMFLSDFPDQGNVFVVDQVKEDGSFDEHKVMYGFSSVDEAKEAYLANYSPGWKGLGNITEVSKEGFKKWIDSSKRKTKPFAEYKVIRENVNSKDATVDNNIRFREEKDDASKFATKHGIDEADVRKYVESMQLGNLGGASLAFQEIRRKKRTENTTDSLRQFSQRFSPIMKELYETFGNVEELREEAVRATMEERNIMESARKRIKAEEETERVRLQEFQNMNIEQLDDEYFKSIEDNDENRMRDLVNEAARRNGYDSDADFRMAHHAPSYDEEGIDKNMINIAENKDDIRDSLDEQLRMNRDQYRDESATAINNALSSINKGEKPTVTIYRAVPKALKEGKVRNGDWVTLSEAYANIHGEHALHGDYRIMKEEVPAENIYWDGNDVNEWGYDDRNDYRHKDTKNNRKLNDLITHDDKGNIIPLSKRFNHRKSDSRFRVGEDEAKDVPMEGQIVAKIEELSESLHTPVRIARTIADVSDGAAKRAIEKGRNIKGWYDPNTGEVVVYLPNTVSTADAQSTILHEVVAHKGLRDMLGKDAFDELCGKVFDALPEDVRNGLMEEYEDRLIAGDEYMASIAENGCDTTLWEKIKGFIRKAFRKIGADLSISDNDIKYLLWKSKNRLMNRDNGMDLVNKMAADAEMKQKLGVSEYGSAQENNSLDKETVEKTIERFDSQVANHPAIHSLYSEEDVDRLSANGIKNVVISELRVAIKSKNIKAAYLPSSNKIVIFPSHFKSENDLESFLWHENTHYILQNSEIENKDRLLDSCLAYVKDEYPDVYSHITDAYKGEQDVWAEESAAYFMQHLFKEYGAERLLSSKFGGDSNIANLVTHIIVKTKDGSRKEEHNQSGRISKGFEPEGVDRRRKTDLSSYSATKNEVEEDRERREGEAETRGAREEGVRFREGESDDYEKEISGLHSRISSLEKKVAKLNDQEDLRRAVTEFIRKEVDSKLVGYLDKKDLNSLLIQTQNAKSNKSLEKIVMNVKNVVLNAQRRKMQRMIDKLLSLQVQDINGKNMSVAKNVDDSTRKIFSFLRGKVSNLALSGFEDDMKSLRRTIRDKHQEVARLNNLLGTAKKEADKQDFNAQVTSLTAEIEELKSKLKSVQDETEAVKEHILNTGDVDIDAEMERLNEKMDNAAMGKDAWTQGDTERIAALNILQGVVTNKKHDSEIESVEIDKQKLILNNSDLYRKRIGKNETERRRLTEQINENHRRIVAYDRLVSDIRSTQVKQMEMTVEELNELISNGKNSLMRRKEEEMKRKRELIGGAIRSVEGKKIDIFDEKAAKEHWLKKFFSAPMGSFEYMCKRVNTKTLGRDGFLYKRFIEGQEGTLKAYDTYILGMKEFRDKLNGKCEDVFGEKFERIASLSDKLVVESGVYVTQPEEGDGYGVKNQIPLTKGQAMYIYQVWKMNDGRTKLELQGFDEESIGQIIDFIEPAYVNFADWVQDDFLKDLREKYNDKYLEMFNTSMADIDNYVPLKILKESIQQDSSLSEDGKKRKTLEERAGSLINRTANTKPVDITYSGFDVLMEHGNQMEGWNAYARVRKDLDYILSSTTFRNQLNANTRGSYNNFHDAAEVATKANHPDDAKYGDEVLGKLSKGLVGGNIAFRLNTALKQLLSAPAFLGYSQHPLFLGHLLKNVVTPYKNFKWCMDNIPSFRERVTNGTTGNEKLDEKGFSKMIDKYIKVGMIPNKIVDAITCSIGAKSIFDYKYGQLKKAGLSEEEARNQAMTESDIYYNATQQSSHPAFLSPMQMSRTFTDRMLTTYQNSNIGYIRKTMAAFYDLTRSRKWQELRRNYKDMYIKEGLSEAEAESKAYRRLLNENRKAVVEFALFGWGLNLLWNIGSQGLLGFFRGDGDDDEDKWTKGLSFALTSPMKGVPGGNLLESIASGYGMNPFLVYDELDKFMQESKKAIEEDGLLSPQIAYLTLAKASRYSGVDLEVWGNIYLGVEGMIRDSALDNDKMIDIMYMLNTPKSNRTEVAKALYKDDPVLVFAEKIARASKYMPEKDPWEGWVPGAKPLNKRRENEIKEVHERLHMSESEKKAADEKKIAQKHRRKLNELKDDPQSKEEYIDQHKEEHELYNKYY